MDMVALLMRRRRSRGAPSASVRSRNTLLNSPFSQQSRLAVWLVAISLLFTARCLAIDHPQAVPNEGWQFYGDQPFPAAQQLDEPGQSNLAPVVNGCDMCEPPHHDSANQPAKKSARPQPAKRGQDDGVAVGYDDAFVIASKKNTDLAAGDFPFQLRINGWGQLRQTRLESEGGNQDLNQFQLKRGRLVFSGSAFTPDFAYFMQIDGRSSSGDDLRLLDYFMTYDVGHHFFGWNKDVLSFKTGKYKMPFTMARYLSGRELEFSDRSMASMYFDVNRSLAWGLFGQSRRGRVPLLWEIAIFNGLVTGGAETGSSGTLDNNPAYSGRLMAYPQGEWGTGELADFDWHDRLATRIGVGAANSAIEREGRTEFDSVRVIDSGSRLSSLLPDTVSKYNVNLFAVDASLKWRGWSSTIEYYLRNVNQFEGTAVPDLLDHGFWLQVGKFIVPRKLELLARWSRVAGDSGTLGMIDQNAEEIAGGFAWYFRDQHAKLVFDATYLDGAPISSAALDIAPGDAGWLFRTQIQFSF